MTSERRRAERFHTNLDARWEGVLFRREGHVVDISPTGCFILTSDEVQIGELIRLEIRAPSGHWIYLWGEVVYKVSEMGFALHFTGTTEAEQTLLEELIARVGGEPDARSY